MAYKTPTAFRQALERRLLNVARERGIDVGRLRRRVVFERTVARLVSAQPGVWIVKGGMALEWRLRERARATRDLDLCLRAEGIVATELRDLLIDALAEDADGDRFSFAVGEPEALQADAHGRPGFRFSLQAILDGREFASVRLDVTSRSDEIQATETLELPATLAFDGIAASLIEVVSPHQSFAEKLHAFTRSYGERENTRVRDLADLVLLIEEGLVSPVPALSIAARVFEVRATHALPNDLPDPPSSWDVEYARLAAEISLEARTMQAGLGRLRSFWSEART